MEKIDAQGFDIKAYKQAERIKYKNIRKNMPIYDKQMRDMAIFEKLISTNAYINADTILPYVSTEIEVDTLNIIRHAIENDKRVAVPKCIDGTCDMEFYYIKSISDLEIGAFGVLEPKVDKCAKMYTYDKGVCIVPGLSFDMKGYRLGYGKGYYDRFLSTHFLLKKIGLCYANSTTTELVSGRFDICVDMLVTDKYIKTINKHEYY